MTDTATPPAARVDCRTRELLFVAIEGPLFAYCLYRVTQALLYGVDGVYERAEVLRDVGLFAAAAAVLIVAGALRLARRPWLSIVVDAAVFALPPLILWNAAANVEPRIDVEGHDAIAFLFIAIEWHKLPRNIWLIFSSAPVYGSLVLLCVAGAFVVAFRFGRRRTVALALVALIVAVVASIDSSQLGERATFFRVVFSTPLVVLAFAAWRGWPRLFARGAVLAAAFGVLYTFYTALTPVEWGRSLPAGVEVLYPAPGEASAVPTEYLRDVWVEPDGETLFATYGPTSGLIRLDVPTARLQTLKTEGLYRHFRTRPDEDELYTVDWLYSQLLRIDKRSFRVLDEHRDVLFLMDGTLIQPIDLEVLPEGFIVISTEYPAVTKYDRETLQRLAQLDLWKMGVTKFRSGAWIINHDPVSGKVYVHVGMLDETDRFAILRIDPATLRIDGRIDDLEAGGLTMIPVPGKRSLLLGDFYSENVVEIDMDTMELRRTLRAVLNTRSLAYDPVRDLIYAASFLTGEVVVLDYESGAELGRTYVTKKPSSFFLDAGARFLYFGGSAGFLRVDLPDFLAEVAPGALSEARAARSAR